MEARQQQLVATIKEWMRVDHEIQSLRRQTKVVNDQKKELSKLLMALMKEKNLDEIDLTDGKIIRKTRTTKTSLNKKHLLECLGKYYKNETTAKEISAYILDARKAKIDECIVCKKEK
jgi:hypothetical protein